MTEGPFTVLLLEDSVVDCAKFDKLFENRNDIHLVAATNSSFDALTLTKKHKPEALIVDIALNDGFGSGTEFLKNLKTADLDFSPLIAVTTNIKSNDIYNVIQNGFADFIFYKGKADYSPDLVIKELLFYRKCKNKSTLDIVIKNSAEEKDKRISDLINSSLDAIGINYNFRGRDYIYDCLWYMLHTDSRKFEEVSPLQHIGAKYNLHPASISRTIQTAIDETWRNSPVDTILSNFTAKVNHHNGSPRPMEFIFYYYNKIKDSL